MSDNLLTNEVKKFITKNITSIAQIEILFLLYLDPSKSWHFEDLSKETRTNVSAVSRNISQLLGLKLVLKSDEKYKYNSENQDTHPQVEQLYNVYKERPVAVIAFIYEKPQDALKGFADAFKLKKD